MSKIIQDIELRKIRPNRLNPRLHINIESLNELARSIKNVGLLEPLIVRPFEDGYEVVVGERRYRASQQANLERVPVIVREYTDDQVIELNLIENIQREDLSGVEKGRSCGKLMEKYPHKYPSQKVLAEKIGVTESVVSEWLRLTRAPEEIQRMVAPVEPVRKAVPKGKIDWKTAVRITQRIKEPERQIEVARELAKKPTRSREFQTVIRTAAKEPSRSVKEIVKEIAEKPYQLPFRLSHMKPILDDIKVQTSRTGVPDPKVKVGAVVHASVWEPHFADLRITMIERKRLRYFDEEDAKKEGGYTLEQFKRVWKEIHGEWNEDQFVYVIHFEKVD
ncbi:ParB/RepB/Spo0J family partition protein [Candidatus Bathyarchaeota archaeon]|nr:ParB/RepB/Spo0J family partition protein [Candidatus Bathyarchaeota archaeon]